SPAPGATGPGPSSYTGCPTTAAATTKPNRCAPDARVLPRGPSAARSPPQAAPPARSARRSPGTLQPAAPPVPRPAALTAPLPGEHRTHRAQQATITTPASQSTTRPGVSHQQN